MFVYYETSAKNHSVDCLVLNYIQTVSHISICLLIIQAPG